MRRRLIEVALPLEAINREAARENFIYKGNPSSIHKWWAQRPLAACRAVLFASLVDDPSSHPDRFPTEEDQEKERLRMFGIIEELVRWENSNDERVLHAAKAEIACSLAWSRGEEPPTDAKAVQAYITQHAPPVLDPFCGGGSIPLEAQRLGLEAHASDLNPVAVLITKALIEIPPKFTGQPPVNPEARKKLDHSRTWRGAQGLADDVRYYGQWMRDEAARRIGHLYPNVRLPKEQGGGEATVLAWLWARTVTCPNPACGARMPLVRSFALSTKKGKETWVEPAVDRKAKTVRFAIGSGTGKPPEGTVGRGGARCIVCEHRVPLDHIRAEGRAGQMSAQMMAIVAGGPRRRVYLPPNEQQERTAQVAVPKDTPDTEMVVNSRYLTPTLYGMTKHRQLFTARQLTALTTLSDLVSGARMGALAHADVAGVPDDGKRLSGDGSGAVAYGDAVALALAMAIDKTAEYGCSLVPWYSKEDRPKGVFARQALPIVWDFAEVNPLGSIGGTFLASAQIVSEAIESCPAGGAARSRVVQLDCTEAPLAARAVMVCTDPPYYDNVPYADLSDFFYVWLRRSLAPVFPDVFSTLLVPKAQELVATPYRFGGDALAAERFFEEGLRRVFGRMRRVQADGYPLSLFYAFKQAESGDDDEHANASRASTGWETMLEGLLDAGFCVTGTWPMRTERAGRTRAIGSNALASSIVLVARPRPDSAALATRKEFLAALKGELPKALKNLQHGNIAPVDLAQAAIGPGMAVFSRYSKVVEADGSRMPVRTALGLINQVLDDVLAEQESEFDADTRWTLAWFEQNGMNEGPYGDAETLSRAKDTSVEGLRQDGLLEAKRGKVRLLRREDLAADWDPAADTRLTVWEVTQHLIRRLEAGGESAAAELLKQVGSLGDVARDLAYRLYNLCERKGWAQEATAYNGLVTAWPELTRLASQTALSEPGQRDLFRRQP